MRPKPLVRSRIVNVGGGRDSALCSVRPQAGSGYLESGSQKVWPSTVACNFFAVMKT